MSSSMREYRRLASRVNQLDEQIVMTIEDEGKGFDPNRLRAEGGLQAVSACLA